MDHQRILDNYVSKVEDGGEDLSNKGEPTDWRSITDDEQDALLTFHRKLAARSKPGVRRHRDLIACNYRLARDLDVDITDGFEEESVAEQVVGYVNSSFGSHETRRDYRRHYASFGKYVTPGDDTPEAMEFINTGYENDYDETPDPSNMIRLDEMRTIADACHNPRDGALVAVAWDTGARPNELYEMRYQDLREYKVGYQAFFGTSKTDTRNVKPLIHSVEYIQKWLDDHPAPERDAPLWCDLTADDEGNVERISQGYFARIFREAMDRVDVNRPHQCRYYRKSMQAFLASKNVNEAHINIRAGRGPTSDKAKRYTSVFGDEHVSQVAEAYELRSTNPRRKTSNPSSVRGATSSTTTTRSSAGTAVRLSIIRLRPSSKTKNNKSDARFSLSLPKTPNSSTRSTGWNGCSPSSKRTPNSCRTRGSSPKLWTETDTYSTSCSSISITFCSSGLLLP